MIKYRLLYIFFSFFLFGVSSFAQKKKATVKSKTIPRAVKSKTTVTKNTPTVPSGNTAIAAPSTPVDSTPRYQSRRNDNSFQLADKDASKARTPLAYENYRKDDQAYFQRIWEEIDVREKMNQSFNYRGEDDNGKGAFVNVMIKIMDDSKDPRKSSEPISAFQDDRFTIPLDEDGVKLAMGGKKGGTVRVRDPNDPSGKTFITKTLPDVDFNPDEVKTYRIKGDWVFDKESSVMKYRLLGIAPLRTYDPTGSGIEVTVPMFWLYYPDLRSSLARYDVYNPKNMGQRMTWEELFESRYFSTYITKSTMDNPNDYRLKDIYEKSTLLQLYEGQRIKDKIFDYEQNLWSY
jgi:gliding motility associated protien GldN